MSRLPLIDHREATGKARELLDGLARRGIGGPMPLGMANAPVVLQAFDDLLRASKRSHLPPPLSERIALAAHEWIGCGYCLAHHTEAARRLGVGPTEIELARRGTSGDPALAPMVELARQVIAAPREVSDEQVEAARRAGYDDEQIAEVVALVALQLLTGAFNLVAGIGPERRAGRPAA